MFAKKKLVHMQTQNELLSINLVRLVYSDGYLKFCYSVVDLFANKLFIQ